MGNWPKVPNVGIRLQPGCRGSKPPSRRALCFQCRTVSASDSVSVCRSSLSALHSAFGNSKPQRSGCEGAGVPGYCVLQFPTAIVAIGIRSDEVLPRSAFWRSWLFLTLRLL